MDKRIENARRLRKEMTKEERKLWYDYLSSYPIRFRRQHPIDRYILDFYCPKAKLAVELDGSQHYEDAGLEHDRERDEVLSRYGIRIIRIPNNEINSNLAGVCDYIDRCVKERCQ